ncbi:MAG: hypothetical protein IT281_03340 [Ignavibacteria bacterium]|nr:hypothetical protein [Ignavibacteria bacterium]
MRNINPTEENIKVPQDMLIDVLSILVKEELKYEITEVLENRASAVIAIEMDQSKPRQIKAVQNIQQILTSYNEYRYSEDETLNWREN